MTEAVLAGEQVEKLALVEMPAVLTPLFAELSRLSENLLMGNGPGDARDGETEQQKEGKLMGQRLF